MKTVRSWRDLIVQYQKAAKLVNKTGKIDFKSFMAIQDAARQLDIRSAWEDLDVCIPPQPFENTLVGQTGPIYEELRRLYWFGECSSNSDFRQTLEHNHPVNDPPFHSDALTGDLGPEAYGYLHKDPANRRWLPFPNQIWPSNGPPWKQYEFSWIHAEVPGGNTTLVGQFDTKFVIQQPATLVSCLSVTSKVDAGFGSFYVIDAEGIFTATHTLCIRISPPATGVPPWRPLPSGQHSREVWRLTMVPGTPGFEFPWTDDSILPFGGASEITLEIPTVGPTQVHVVERISFDLDLTQGVFITPPWPSPDLQIEAGLGGEFAPLCWRLEGACPGIRGGYSRGQ